MRVRGRKTVERLGPSRIRITKKLAVSPKPARHLNGPVQTVQ